MYPKIEPGGSFMVAWQLKDRRVLIVGGGVVASQRLAAVLSADALVTLIAPRSSLHPLISALISTSPRITYHDRTFAGAEDLSGADMVLTAIDDATISSEIAAHCRTLKIPINAADLPPSCDFYFGSQVRRGPLQIAISTNGNGPKLASIIKHRVEKAIPDNVGDAIERVGMLRRKLRERAPGVGGELGKRRMQWVTKVCEAWELDDLARLDEDAIEKLLDEGWERDVVLHPKEVFSARLAWPSMPSQGSALLSVGFVTGLVATLSMVFIARLVRRRGSK